MLVWMYRYITVAFVKLTREMLVVGPFMTEPLARDTVVARAVERLKRDPVV